MFKEGFREWLIVALILTVALGTLMAKPERPGPKEEKKKGIPNLSGETNWGKLEQVGKQFKLSGHPNWDGAGHIRDDGSVFILWTNLNDGNIGPGVYSVTKDLELRGEWGYAEEVRVEKDGKIVGNSRGDHVYKISR